MAHTGCGLRGLDDGALRERLTSEFGQPSATNLRVVRRSRGARPRPGRAHPRPPVAGRRARPWAGLRGRDRPRASRRVAARNSLADRNASLAVRWIGPARSESHIPPDRDAVSVCGRYSDARNDHLPGVVSLAPSPATSPGFCVRGDESTGRRWPHRRLGMTSAPLRRRHSWPTRSASATGCSSSGGDVVNVYSLVVAIIGAVDRGRCCFNMLTRRRVLDAARQTRSATRRWSDEPQVRDNRPTAAE